MVTCKIDDKEGENGILVQSDLRERKFKILDLTRLNWKWRCHNFDVMCLKGSMQNLISRHY